MSIKSINLTVIQSGPVYSSCAENYFNRYALKEKEKNSWL